MILVVQHVISLADALKIVKFFNKQKHRGLGYSFDLQELGLPYIKCQREDTYREYTTHEPMYMLRVYQEK